jgi:hypothetical protein
MLLTCSIHQARQFNYQGPLACIAQAGSMAMRSGRSIATLSSAKRSSRVYIWTGRPDLHRLLSIRGQYLTLHYTNHSWTDRPDLHRLLSITRQHLTLHYTNHIWTGRPDLQRLPSITGQHLTLHYTNHSWTGLPDLHRLPSIIG